MKAIIPSLIGVTIIVLGAVAVHLSKQMNFLVIIYVGFLVLSIAGIAKPSGQKQ